MSGKSWVFLFLIGFVLSCSQKKEDEELKRLVKAQLQNTHTNEEWFAPTSVALEGLTYEQAIWKDSTTNHSIELQSEGVVRQLIRRMDAILRVG